MDEFHPAFDLVAVFAFLVGHVLIIGRNGQGLRAYFRSKSGPGEMLPDVLLGVGIVLVTAILFVLTLLDHLRGSPLLYVLPVYALFLAVSLWTGWMTLRVGYFPQDERHPDRRGGHLLFCGRLFGGFQSIAATVDAAGHHALSHLGILYAGHCALGTERVPVGAGKAQADLKRDLQPSRTPAEDMI